MESEKPIITASLTRTILLPLAGVYLLFDRKVSLEFLFANNLWKAFGAYFLFLITITLIFYKNTVEVDDHPVDFLNAYYHSKTLGAVMSWYVQLLQTVVKVIFKPLKYVAYAALFAFPFLWGFGVMRPDFKEPYELVMAFCCFFIFCEIFLYPREELLIHWGELSQSLITKRREAIILFAHSTEYRGPLDVPSLPRDFFPSISFYVFAIIKIAFYHLLNVLIYLTQKLHLKRGAVVIIPLVMLFDVLAMLTSYLFLGVFTLVSFTLRYFLWISFIGLFFFFLYFNFQNFYQSFYNRSWLQALSSVGITFLSFLALEMLRHLLLILPLKISFSKPDQTPDYPSL